MRSDKLDMIEDFQKCKKLCMTTINACKKLVATTDTMSELTSAAFFCGLDELKAVVEDYFGTI